MRSLANGWCHVVIDPLNITLFDFHIFIYEPLKFQQDILHLFLFLFSPSKVEFPNRSGSKPALSVWWMKYSNPREDLIWAFIVTGYDCFVQECTIIYTLFQFIKSDSKYIYIQKVSISKEQHLFEHSVHQRIPKRMHHGFHKYVAVKKRKMFLEQQVIILEWFLKDHMTLKTGAIMLEIQHFKIYSNRKQYIVKNSKLLLFLLYFD